jgi:hypothetical protein
VPGQRATRLVSDWIRCARGEQITDRHVRDNDLEGTLVWWVLRPAAGDDLSEM